MREMIGALIVLTLCAAAGLVILWKALDAVMRGVTEMERNLGGGEQAVKDFGPPERDE